MILVGWVITIIALVATHPERISVMDRLKWTLLFKSMELIGWLIALIALISLYCRLPT